jgi:hypothetical protein
VYVVGWDGDDDSDGAPLVVNNDSAGPALRGRAGVQHRLRFVNIGVAQKVAYELKRGDANAEWTPAAKDGADLPSNQRVKGRALQLANVGETFDAVFTPEPGEYTVIVRFPAATGRVVYRQRMVFE